MIIYLENMKLFELLKLRNNFLKLKKKINMRKGFLEWFFCVDCENDSLEVKRSCKKL